MSPVDIIMRMNITTEIYTFFTPGRLRMNPGGWTNGGWMNSGDMIRIRLGTNFMQLRDWIFEFVRMNTGLWRRSGTRSDCLIQRASRSGNSPNPNFWFTGSEICTCRMIISLCSTEMVTVSIRLSG